MGSLFGIKLALSSEPLVPINSVQVQNHYQFASVSLAMVVGVALEGMRSTGRRTRVYITLRSVSYEHPHALKGQAML